MTIPRRRPRKRSHQYDTTMKELVQQNPQEIVAVLLPGAVYQETLNVEAIRPSFRADKVFKIVYKRQECILHLEFETRRNEDMELRLLNYNVILHRDHRLPVVSMVIYLFPAKLPISPYLVIAGLAEEGPEIIINFTFKVLPLFAEDGVKYVQNHIASMYPLLPTMQHVNRVVIRQAIDELITLYDKDEAALAQQITWMKLMLERTATIPKVEKREIQEELHMFDRIVEESPWLTDVRNRNRDIGRAEGLVEGEARGEAKGEVRGELRSARRYVTDIVELRFAVLLDYAQLSVERTNDADKLRRVAKELVVATDEMAAIRILNTLSA